MFNPLRPWVRPGRLFDMVTYNLTALVVSVVTFSLVIPFLAVTVGLLITFVLALPFAWLVSVLSHGLATVERARTAALMGERIPDPVPPPSRHGFIAGLRERAGSTPRWKEVGYHAAHLPVSCLAFALTATAWCGSLAMALLPAYVDALPGDSAKFYFFELEAGQGAWLASVVGILGVVFVAPWVSIGLAHLQLALAKSLLGPSPDAVHAAQVTKLETSRVAAVDSAESERRRIERDLHDGAQQRLVALAANLGSAREKLEADPDAGRAPSVVREMVADAHEEAKAALREIRDLVRGIHPVILEDRGLDAALSAVVARSPVPVTLDVQVAKRPSPAIESAAYFVVSEALTNVARHAHATRADVGIARAGDRLVIEVRDNGRGGADVTKGSGLQGLRDRVAGLGGSMYVISPEGGPTTISVELPCGS